MQSLRSDLKRTQNESTNHGDKVTKENYELIRELTEMSTTLQLEVDTIQQQQLEQSDENDKLKIKISEMQNILTEKDNQNVVLKNQKETLLKEKSGFQKQIKKLNQEFEILRLELLKFQQTNGNQSELENVLKQKNIEIESLLIEIDTLKISQNQMEEDKKTNANEKKLAKAAALKNEASLKEIQRQFEIFGQEKNSLLIQFQNLSNENQSISNENDLLKQDQSAKIDENQKLQKELDAIRKAYQTLENENKIHSADKKSLQEQLEGVRSDNDKILQNEKSRLEKENQSLKMENSNMLNENKELLKNIEMRYQTEKAVMMKQFKAEKANQDQIISELQSSQTALQNEKLTIQKENSSFKESNKNLSNELKSLESSEADLKASVAQKDNSIMKFEQSLLLKVKIIEEQNIKLNKPKKDNQTQCFQECKDNTAQYEQQVKVDAANQSETTIKMDRKTETKIMQKIDVSSQSEVAKIDSQTETVRQPKFDAGVQSVNAAKRDNSCDPVLRPITHAGSQSETPIKISIFTETTTSPKFDVESQSEITKQQDNSCDPVSNPKTETGSQIETAAKKDSSCDPVSTQTLEAGSQIEAALKKDSSCNPSHEEKTDAGSQSDATFNFEGASPSGFNQLLTLKKVDSSSQCDAEPKVAIKAKQDNFTQSDPEILKNASFILSANNKDSFIQCDDDYAEYLTADIKQESVSRGMNKSGSTRQLVDSRASSELNDSIRLISPPLELQSQTVTYSLNMVQAVTLKQKLEAEQKAREQIKELTKNKIETPKRHLKKASTVELSPDKNDVYLEEEDNINDFTPRKHGLGTFDQITETEREQFSEDDNLSQSQIQILEINIQIIEERCKELLKMKERCNQVAKDDQEVKALNIVTNEILSQIKGLLSGNLNQEQIDRVRAECEKQIGPTYELYKNIYDSKREGQKGDENDGKENLKSKEQGNDSAQKGGKKELDDDDEFLELDNVSENMNSDYADGNINSLLKDQKSIPAPLKDDMLNESPLMQNKTNLAQNKEKREQTAPSDPAGPVDPSDLTDPVDPSDPLDLTDISVIQVPSDPTVSADPADSTETKTPQKDTDQDVQIQPSDRVAHPNDNKSQLVDPNDDDGTPEVELIDDDHKTAEVQMKLELIEKSFEGFEIQIMSLFDILNCMLNFSQKQQDDYYNSKEQLFEYIEVLTSLQGKRDIVLESIKEMNKDLEETKEDELKHSLKVCDCQECIQIISKQQIDLLQKITKVREEVEMQIQQKIESRKDENSGVGLEHIIQAIDKIEETFAERQLETYKGHVEEIEKLRIVIAKYSIKTRFDQLISDLSMVSDVESPLLDTLRNQVEDTKPQVQEITTHQLDETNKIVSEMEQSLQDFIEESKPDEEIKARYAELQQILTLINESEAYTQEQMQAIEQEDEEPKQEPVSPRLSGGSPRLSLPNKDPIKLEFVSSPRNKQTDKKPVSPANKMLEKFGNQLRIKIPDTNSSKQLMLLEHEQSIAIIQSDYLSLFRDFDTEVPKFPSRKSWLLMISLNWRYRSQILSLLTRIRTIQQALKPRFTYKAVKGDKVDALFGEAMVRAQMVELTFTRISQGKYLFGTRTVTAKITNESLLIRVGGGYMEVNEFIQYFGPMEIAKLKTRINPKLLKGDTLSSGGSARGVITNPSLKKIPSAGLSTGRASPSGRGSIKKIEFKQKYEESSNGSSLGNNDTPRISISNVEGKSQSFIEQQRGSIKTPSRLSMADSTPKLSKVASSPRLQKISSTPKLSMASSTPKIIPISPRGLQSPQSNNPKTFTFAPGTTSPSKSRNSLRISYSSSNNKTAQQTSLSESN